MMNSADKQAVLHCLKSMIDEEVCEECLLYGTTGTDHCEKDCVRLAINALEREPCEDAISRQEVIELCEGWWLGHTKEDDFATEIRALPSVNPQKSSWIPVSERLPEESGMYLCSYDDDDVGTSYFDIRMNEFNMLHEQVAAWMYIPEPYKQEVEDE